MNVEECEEQVVRADMKRSVDKCNHPASRQQKSPVNEIEASDFTTSTLKAPQGGGVSMDNSKFICFHRIYTEVGRQW